MSEKHSPRRHGPSLHSPQAAPDRGPQQGIAVPGRRRDPARVRLPPAPRHQGARAHRPGERRRVLLPAPPRHRALRRRGHPRCRHHRTRPPARLGRQGRGAADPRLRPQQVPLRRAGGEFTDVGQLAGKRIATSYVGVVQDFLDRARDRGDRDQARRRGRERTPARRRRRDRRRGGDRQHAARGRAGDVRRGRARVGGGADHPYGRRAAEGFEVFGAASTASWSPAAT